MPVSYAFSSSQIFSYSVKSISVKLMKLKMKKKETHNNYIRFFFCAWMYSKWLDVCLIGMSQHMYFCTFYCRMLLWWFDFSKQQSWFTPLKMNLQKCEYNQYLLSDYYLNFIVWKVFQLMILYTYIFRLQFLQF